MPASHVHSVRPPPLHAWWRLSLEAGTIAAAAPVVIAHRCIRMWLGGATPDARDRAEFARMAPEKLSAAAEAQQAAWREAMAVQSAWLSAVLGGGAQPWHLAEHALHAWPRIVTSGLGPIRKRVTANAHRLTRMAPLGSPARRRSHPAR